MTTKNTQLRVFTWHVHGTYLYYLSHANVEFFLPVNRERSDGYGGRSGSFPWPENVHEIDVADVLHHQFDCVLFQSKKHFLEDQYEILSPLQRTLPRIYLEHDPPREHATDTKHVASGADLLLVHVTHFNDLMWDAGTTPTKVIEHGVPEAVGPTRADKSDLSGTKPRGIVMVNNLELRGRRLGHDVFERVRREIPLDLVGMNSVQLGGLGEISYPELPHFLNQYRFFFNPIRYTSLGLSVCEAMMAGLPFVGLATTEMSTAVMNGVTGYVDTNVETLIERMRMLLENPECARVMGSRARMYAIRRFSIERFAREWEETFRDVTQKQRAHSFRNIFATSNLSPNEQRV